MRFKEIPCIVWPVGCSAILLVVYVISSVDTCLYITKHTYWKHWGNSSMLTDFTQCWWNKSLHLVVNVIIVSAPFQWLYSPQIKVFILLHVYGLNTVDFTQAKGANTICPNPPHMKITAKPFVSVLVFFPCAPITKRSFLHKRMYHRDSFLGKFQDLSLDDINMRCVFLISRMSHQTSEYYTCKI